MNGALSIFLIDCIWTGPCVFQLQVLVAFQDCQKIRLPCRPQLAVLQWIWDPCLQIQTFLLLLHLIQLFCAPGLWLGWLGWSLQLCQ